jgi:hypothetical protein
VLGQDVVGELGDTGITDVGQHQMITAAQGLCRNNLFQSFSY